MPSNLLRVDCFEDKAIYIIKNIFQLTKYHLVPQGELLEFLRPYTYPQNLLGSKIAQMQR